MHSDGSRPQDSVWEVCEAVRGRTVFTALLYIRTLKNSPLIQLGQYFLNVKYFYSTFSKCVSITEIVIMVSWNTIHKQEFIQHYNFLNQNQHVIIIQENNKPLSQSAHLATIKQPYKQIFVHVWVLKFQQAVIC